MLAAALLGAAVLVGAHAASPVNGFRPPGVPLFAQSPLINVWSFSDHLYDSTPVHWTNNAVDWFAALRVDTMAYLLMGSPSPSWSGAKLMTATQTSVAVWATQTRYQFTAGPVAVNLTFTSPLITENWDLLSRPAHYVTFDVASTDGGSHAVSFYFDVSADAVVRDSQTAVSWDRRPVTGVDGKSVTALSVGATKQKPLSSTDDRMDWGIVYLLADTSSGSGASTVLEYANVTRSAFWNSGAIPSTDNTQQPAPLRPPGPMLPPTGPQAGIDRSGNDMPGYPVRLNASNPDLCWAMCNQTAGCQAWAYAVPGCDGYAQPQCWLKSSDGSTSNNKCRVSGSQARPSYSGLPLAAAVVYNLGAVTPAGASRFVTVAVDEILSLRWFGEDCPPYWRRSLPVGDSSVVPMAMLADAFTSYSPVRQLCNNFDASTATMLSAAGGDQYATLTQLTYRQVFGGSALIWLPSKAAAWYLLKEISSCGCLDTSDVVYPAFPQILYYAPELMRLMVVPHLEYAMNFTNQPYPLPWAPHHLGYWPIADLPYQNQENMPLEETSWNLLIIAAIAQREGGDLTWLAPYWPAIQSWYSFLITLLPFPQEQLSTDDFDGPLYNATNLALKGVSAIAAYGYIVEKYTGNTTAAAEAYATAAQYATVMVQYSWVTDHFLIGYKGSQGDGGDPNSWPMLYNALWLRLLGQTDLLPNQASLLSSLESWYATNKMQKYGLPLNSRKLYTKDDWMTFLAATFYDNSATPKPSAFSNALFSGFYNWAQDTTSREAISDWTNTDSPTAVGFTARPVFGAMYAPVLVANAAQLGLGQETDSAVAHMNAVFRETHAKAAAAEAVTTAMLY